MWKYYIKYKLWFQEKWELQLQSLGGGGVHKFCRKQSEQLLIMSVKLEQGLFIVKQKKLMLKVKIFQ